MDANVSLHIARRTALKPFLAVSVLFSPQDEPYASQNEYEP